MTNGSVSAQQKGLGLPIQKDLDPGPGSATHQRETWS